MKPIIRKSFAGAALALGLIGGPLAGMGGALLIPSAAQAQTAPTLEQMKQTLARYGEFVSHAKYGEVWKPTVTPRGWRPYPACDWVYAKDYGWYFSDKTAWGSIVHHYGRWIHDENDGWLWVPGAEFSPGWVLWRTSADWVGWAPTPPDIDMTPEAMATFDDDKLWTFMDAKKFGSTCDSGFATAAQFGDVYRNTTYVKEMRFVNGIGVYALPPYAGPTVNVDIDVFAPWSKTFIGTWIINWTKTVVVINNYCDPNVPRTPNDPRDPQTPRRPPLTHVETNNPPPPPPRLGGGGHRPRQIDQFRPPAKSRQPRRAGGRSFEPAPKQGIVIDTGRASRSFGPRRPHRSFEPKPDADDFLPDRGPRQGFEDGRRGFDLGLGFSSGRGDWQGRGVGEGQRFKSFGPSSSERQGGGKGFGHFD